MLPFCFRRREKLKHAKIHLTRFQINLSPNRDVIVGFIPTIHDHCRSLFMDVRKNNEHDCALKD
jgi:hypothetical protein